MFQVRKEMMGSQRLKDLIWNSVYKEGADESSLFWWQIYEKYFNKEQADSAKLGFQKSRLLIGRLLEQSENWERLENQSKLIIEMESTIPGTPSLEGFEI